MKALIDYFHMTIKRYLHRLRRALSRVEWVAQLLDLPCEPIEFPAPGVIIIQIDGLAYEQLIVAMRKKRLPFLRRKLKKQRLFLMLFYSGVPSTTPAVQGEIFFGEKTIVPGFEFYDRKTGQKHAMMYPWSVDYVINKHRPTGTPLLKDGTSYSNIYAAGAKEARYCIETVTLESFIKTVNPIKIAVIFILYFTKIIRLLGLALLETGIAIVDFFRGVVERQQVIKELKFIPTRVFVSCVLRELIRFRVKLDARQGVKTIHANFVGYDEQAHRRGPDSAFAHWTLKGIDDAIRDIFQSAKRSNCRRYQMIIYSDHGQERVISYPQKFGRSVVSVIRECLQNSGSHPYGNTYQDNSLERSYMTYRSRWYFSKEGDDQQHLENRIDPDQVEVTTMGPIGHIYFPNFRSSKDLMALAEKLVGEAHIPLVLFRMKDRTWAVNEKDIYDLRKQYTAVLGADHPFARWAAVDMDRTCRHPFAGDLVISGWRPDKLPLSFNIENGAHGGPGRNETRGFVMLPEKIHTDAIPFRGLDLREYVKKVLNK